MKFICKWHGLGEEDAIDLFSLKAANAEKILMQGLSGDNSLQTMPQWVVFSTTTFCNLKCPHCHTHGTEEVRSANNKQYWPNELTHKIAAETLPSAYKFCLTLNGEPLAMPRLRELLKTLQPYGAKLHLTTNGTLMSKDVLIQLLPLVDRIDISIDGGTKGVVEAIRLGSNFEQLIHRVRVLTRACELLSSLVAPPIRFAFTVMGSNIRDMPEVIRLAHALGVGGVDFFPLHIYYPNLADEAVDLYAPLYNAYYQRTLEVAHRLKIDVSIMLPMFPDVGSDPDFVLVGMNMLTSLPDDYYDTLVTPESFLDLDKIESDAIEVEKAVKAGIKGVAPLAMFHKFRNSIRCFKIVLSEINKNSKSTIPWCEELATRAFITSSGDLAPCCRPGRPSFGNINNESVADIWNGPNRATFRERFLSSSPPDCCMNCRDNIRISRWGLIARFINSEPWFSVLMRFRKRICSFYNVA